MVQSSEVLGRRSDSATPRTNAGLNKLGRREKLLECEGQASRNQSRPFSVLFDNTVRKGNDRSENKSWRKTARSSGPNQP